MNLCYAIKVNSLEFILCTRERQEWIFVDFNLKEHLRVREERKGSEVLHINKVSLVYTRER